MFQPDTNPRMFHWLKDRNRTGATALELYGSSVAQARSGVFYRELAVADSFSGRFDLVMLHVGLLARRLTVEGGAGKDLARSLIERMFAALDDDMRELGVGDLTVPKKIQAAAGTFYGRLAALESAFGQPGAGGLEDVLTRNVTAAEGRVLSAASLAAYVRSAASLLAAQPFAQLQQGLASFPKPEESLK